MKTLVITANKSELQLQSFLQHIEQRYTTLCLSPQGDNTMIEKDAINLCTVSSFGKDYIFGGISESFYDKMVSQYDWRNDEVRAKHIIKK